MTFLSIEFLLWLFSLAVLFWWVPPRWRGRVSAIAGFLFVARFDVLSAGLLALFSLITWLSARAGIGRVMAAAGVVLVAVLSWFKLGAADAGDDVVRQLVVPLGLSYYTLRCLHYLFESHRQTLPSHGLDDWLAYLFFLPTMVAGPIHRIDGFLRDARRHRFEADNLSTGLERILFGYARIVILGNWLISSVFAAWIEQSDFSPGLTQYLECFRYGLNLYFQFAGYSDIAIGMGWILGYRIMENFHNPYLAVNIADFWRRWHVSLSSWCRDYIFMPVMASTRIRVLAVLASMIVLGLWHEFSWRYIAWGAYHGAGILVWHGFQRIKLFFPVVGPHWLRHGIAVFVTVNFVILGFALTKESTLSEGISSWMAMAGVSGGWQ